MGVTPSQGSQGSLVGRPIQYDHYHFLKNTGKILLGAENQQLKTELEEMLKQDGEEMTIEQLIKSYQSSSDQTKQRRKRKRRR